MWVSGSDMWQRNMHGFEYILLSAGTGDPHVLSELLQLCVGMHSRTAFPAVASTAIMAATCSAALTTR